MTDWDAALTALTEGKDEVTEGDKGMVVSMAPVWSQYDLWTDGMKALLDKAGPAGMIRDAIITALSLPDVWTFHRVKGLLQRRLSSDDRTVVGDSATALVGGWTYSLQSDPTHRVSKRYNVQKVRGLYGRTVRAYEVAVSLANGIPGNSSTGRAARRLARSLYRTLEDMVDTFAELGLKEPVLPAKL